MVGEKRKNSQDQSSEPNKKQKANEQNAQGNEVKVSVGTGVEIPKEASLFVSTDGTIYDAPLQRTDITTGTNQFYRLQILKVPNGKYWVRASWGRTGGHSQSRAWAYNHRDIAKANFSWKCQQKTGHRWIHRKRPPIEGKYVFLRMHYEDDSGGVGGGSSLSGGVYPTALPLRVQVRKILGLLFNGNFLNKEFDDIEFHLEKIPLGRLSAQAITEGGAILERLKYVIETSSNVNSNKRKRIELTNAYYSAIPHIFRGSRPSVIDNEILLQQEIEFMKILQEMEIGWRIMKEDQEYIQTRERFQQLNLVEMTPLAHGSREFKQLESYFTRTSDSTQGYTCYVEDIFRIEREPEAQQATMEAHTLGSKGKRRLLWHGSRPDNFRSILSEGLRIPPRNSAPKAFGHGIYFADMSAKSIPYCGVVLGESRLLLLCEVELGRKMFKCYWGYATTQIDCMKNGHVAVKGRGVTKPEAWVDAGYINGDLKGVLMPITWNKLMTKNDPRHLAQLKYNEYVVYQTSQVKLRYIFSVKCV